MRWWEGILDRLGWRNPHGPRQRPHIPELHHVKNQQQAQELRLHQLEREIAARQREQYLQDAVRRQQQSEGHK